MNERMRPLQNRATPLHQAAASGATSAVAALVAAGASLDVVDVAGMTPLMCAARGGHLAAVRALVEAGANVHLVDSVSTSMVRQRCANAVFLYPIHFSIFG